MIFTNVHNFFSGSSIEKKQILSTEGKEKRFFHSFCNILYIEGLQGGINLQTVHTTSKILFKFAAPIFNFFENVDGHSFSNLA